MATTSKPRRASGLSRAAFLEAALAIVDQHGLEQLTMRSLARATGADPTAVYRYFASKDALLGALVDHALSELAIDAKAASGPMAAAEDRAMGFRTLLLRHPGIVPLMVVETPMTAAQVHATAAGLRELLAAGLEPAAAVDVYCAVYAYVVGFVAQEVAAAGAWSVDDQREQARELARRELGDLPEEELDAIAVATAFRQAGDEHFLFGLRLLLGGVAVPDAGRAGTPRFSRRSTR